MRGVLEIQSVACFGGVLDLAFHRGPERVNEFVGRRESLKRCLFQWHKATTMIVGPPARKIGGADLKFSHPISARKCLKAPPQRTSAQAVARSRRSIAETLIARTMPRINSSRLGRPFTSSVGGRPYPMLPTRSAPASRRRRLWSTHRCREETALSAALINWIVYFGC